MGKDYLEMQFNPDKNFDDYYKRRCTLTYELRQPSGRASNIDEIIRKSTSTLHSHHVAFISKLMTRHNGGFSEFIGECYRITGVALALNQLEFHWETASSTSNEQGVVVGTGNAAIDLRDFELDNKISSGSTPGGTQLLFSAVTIGGFTNSPTTEWNFKIDRDFQNNQGPDAGGGIPVTIEECGYYIEMNVNGERFLGERTLKTQVVDNEPGQTLNASYIEKVAV